MRSGSTALVFIIIITICSIFVANVTNLISTDKNIAHKLHQHQAVHTETKKLTINDNDDHLMWFIQISDLHISIFDDESRVTQLKEFVHKTVDAIKPAVVLASGDLTDAKAPNFIVSTQYEKEWKTYYDVLYEAGIQEKTVWLDIRGNHDNFDVPGRDSPRNYFTKYSIQGKRHPKSYMYQKKVGSEKYTFIAVDACLDPGPKRPHNFLGLLKQEDTEQLIDYVHQSRRNGGNFTIWFGHYPTSCILAPGTGREGIRSIFGQFNEGYVYLCGHLHTFGGIIPNMYTLHKEGFLELELGDWKHNRIFRVAAIDHGLFSFVDVRHNEWPIILITNPKHPLYRIPTRENPTLQLESTHIRILTFSLSEIVGCTVKIDDEPAEACEKINDNLFVQKWTPQRYTSQHKIYVTITDADGRTKTIEQPFTNGNTNLEFAALARFVLMTELITVFRVPFWIAVVLCVVPLSILRLWHWLVSKGKLNRPRLRYNCIKRFISKLWVLASIDRLFYPIVSYCIYLTFGPWSFGQVVNDSMSITFVWGIYVNGTWLPPNLTYLYGFFQLMLCQFPMIFVCANVIYRRFRTHVGVTTKKDSICKLIYLNLGFILIITIELILMIAFYIEYGFVALLIDPLRTWSVFLNVYLWYQSHTLPEKKLRPASDIWRQETTLIHQK